jgi:hypothetical protein
MKWRTSTLRKAAELQLQIEHLQRVLAGLLKASELTGTASKSVKGRAVDDRQRLLDMMRDQRIEKRLARQRASAVEAGLLSCRRKIKAAQAR